MKPERYRQVKQLFAGAIECEIAQRPDFLARACAGDEELRGEVESLLAHDEPAGKFIEESAFEVTARLLAAGEAQALTAERIGPYKVLDEIGRGGMGVVYLAIRDDDEFHKQVAIKLIKRGMDTDAVVRRFRNERQILANLEHPNIARLLDGGTTDAGLPYLVMEYVEGTPVTDYCDAHRLKTNERLQLFRTICAAVQSAHQNLVVHRDLKPSNILVTADGTPKLLDFGIAKLLDPALSALEQTRTELRALTPDYASPEQVRGEKLATTSDVYSLGVVLYELLTGHRPYRAGGAPPHELARIICEQEPPKPSTIVGHTEVSARSDTEPPTNITPEVVSRARDTQPDKLRRRLAGDLDNIALMALRKEPARRYKSVEQFAADIERHLKGLPVSARKDTFAYRAAKFAGRNRAAVFAAVLITLAVIAGLIIALWQADAARRQRDLAQHERRKAERINQFLQQMLSFSNQSATTSVWPVAQTKDVTVNEMLAQITPQVEAELADQPDVRAQVLRTIGSAYASQGQYDLAEQNLRAALAAQTQLYGADDPEVAATMSELGVLSLRQIKYDEASRLLEQAVAIYRRERQTNAPSYSAVKHALALDYLATTKFYQVDPYVAKPFLLEALQITAAAHLPVDERRVLPSIKSDAGAVMASTGELEKGEALLHEALAEYRQNSPRPQWEQGATLTMLGAAALIRHQPDEAEKYLLEGEQVYRETLGEKSFYLASNLNRQAAAFVQKNDLKAAEAKARASLVVARDFSPDNRLLWAAPMWTLGNVLSKTGRAREGEDYLRQALAIYEQQATKNYFTIANLKIDLSKFLLTQNRLPEAERVARAALDEARQNLGAQHPLLQVAANNLRDISEKQGAHAATQSLK
jgi:serine/threonine protein kinase